MQQKDQRRGDAKKKPPVLSRGTSISPDLFIWSTASLPSLIKKLTFKIYLQISIVFVKHHHWFIFMLTKVTKPMSLSMLFCLSIFHFGVFNGSALAKYLLFFILELCAFMKLSWKDS